MLQHRRARYDYELLEHFEAGMVLQGSEVKALRQGGGTIAEAYARVKDNEVWLEGMHIPPYKDASYNNHPPIRPRKLLLKRSEIRDIRKALERKGLSLVPTKLYFKDGWIKMVVALGRGKKLHDKRQDAAKRDAKREMERALR